MKRVQLSLILTITIIILSAIPTLAAPFTPGTPGTGMVITEYGAYGFEDELVIGAGYSISPSSAVGIQIVPKRSPITIGGYTTKSLGPVTSNSEVFYASGKIIGTTTAQYLVDYHWLKLSAGAGAYFDKNAPSGRITNYFLISSASLTLGRNLTFYGRANYWLSSAPDYSYDLGMAVSY